MKIRCHGPLRYSGNVVVAGLRTVPRPRLVGLHAPGPATAGRSGESSEIDRTYFRKSFGTKTAPCVVLLIDGLDAEGRDAIAGSR
jgi:hypothetical protein